MGRARRLLRRSIAFGRELWGLINVKPLWTHDVGSIFGQLLYGVVFLPFGPLAVVGLLFLAVWSLLFLVRAYLACLVRTLALGR